MSHQNQQLIQQQIKKLEDQKIKLEGINMPGIDRMRKDIDEKIKVLKTNKPVSK